MYDCTFPGLVKSHVGIDSVGFHIPSDLSDLSKNFKLGVEGLLKLEKMKQAKIEPRAYTYEEAKIRLNAGSGPVENNSINDNVAHHILDRGLTLLEGKFNDKNEQLYTWSRDFAVALPSWPASSRPTIEAMIDSYNENCRENPEDWTKQMHLMASDSIWIKYFVNQRTKDMNKVYLENYGMMFDKLSENPHRQWHLMKGTHHFHLNEPKAAAGRICEWINDTRGQSTMTFADYAAEYGFEM